ncbi:MAG: hypothetical protein GXY44_02395 [Phycisphaerales bacterium]|nr:hypothetical protein [Phycisphaerales bacterium]
MMDCVPLSFQEKTRLVLACVVAVLVLDTVGWHAAGPVDPDMAVTLVLRESGMMSAWIIVGLLVAVSSAVGTAIAGRRLPEAGLFAAGVGLIGLALRGGGMQVLLGYYPADSEAARSTLMRHLVMDSLLWAAVLFGAWFVSWTVWRWLWAGSLVNSVGSDNGSLTSVTAGGGSLSGKPTVATVDQASPWSGWPALLVTAMVGAIFIWLTIARSPVAAIARGQVIASVAGGLFFGAMTARYFTGINQSHWYVLAALAVALIGYLLGYLRADMAWATNYKYYTQLATTPPHELVRPLPIEYLGVGVAGALLGFWASAKVEQAVESTQV